MSVSSVNTKYICTQQTKTLQLDFNVQCASFNHSQNRFSSQCSMSCWHFDVCSNYPDESWVEVGNQVRWKLFESFQISQIAQITILHFLPLLWMSSESPALWYYGGGKHWILKILFQSSHPCRGAERDSYKLKMFLRDSKTHSVSQLVEQHKTTTRIMA